MKIQSQSRVRVSYQVSLVHDGSVLEAVDATDPHELQLGEGAWPIQVELALLGEQTGNTVQAEVSAADQAFGLYDSERVQVLPLSDFNSTPVSGELMEFTMPGGQLLEGVVQEVDQQEVNIDFNHPYIGRNLKFEITVIEVLK